MTSETKSAFLKIKEREEAVKLERRDTEEARLYELNREETSERLRIRDLRKKANKAEKFLKCAEYIGYEEYLRDLQIEVNIEIKRLGLSGKSSRDIGDKVIRLSERSALLECLLNDPKSLVKEIKRNSALGVRHIVKKGL